MKRLFWVVSAAVVMQAAPLAAQGDAKDEVRRAGERIQFANYPAGALRRGEEGTVGIRVTTDAYGRLMDCDVTKSSGFASLDEASCDFLLRYGHAKPFLSPDGKRVQQKQDGQVVWKLPEGHARAAVPAAGTRTASLASADNRRICKVQPQIGSLVGGKRICMTSGEWQNQRNEAQRDLESMQPRYRSGQ